MKKILLIIIFIAALPASAQQTSFGFGTFGGIGSIKGNSPSQTSFTISPFFEISPPFWEGIKLRAAFFYARKLEYLLPENRQGRYYPFLRGINIKAVASQDFSRTLFLEYGLGPLVLNDRTFSDTNVWTYGISAATSVGIKLIENKRNTFSAAVGTEYGATFTNTSASYFSFHLQLVYTLH